MKRLLTILILTALTLSSCLKEEDSAVNLEVQLLLPEGNKTEIDLSALEIRLQSKDLPFTFTTRPDRNGHAAFLIQPGRYDLIASLPENNTGIAVNASVPEFMITSKGIVNEKGGYDAPVIEAELMIAITNGLIIRELYYQGSTTAEGKGYQKDQYMELYNNTGPHGSVLYLDSLCIATIHPANSTSSNNAWEGKDTIAIFQMFWMFPGNGSSYPLAPGESAVIAIRAAVDHSSRSTSGLQLNKAHFGCYADHLPSHEIAAGVTPLVCHMAGQGTGWGFSISSPALVIFRPEMGVRQYRAHPERWERYEPGTSSGRKYWHIAKEWILDGIECVHETEKIIKRLPGDIDAAYSHMESPSYSGRCVTRKLVSAEEGIEIFMDTNNSANDLIPDSVPAPRLKK